MKTLYQLVESAEFAKTRVDDHPELRVKSSDPPPVGRYRFRVYAWMDQLARDGKITEKDMSRLSPLTNGPLMRLVKRLIEDGVLNTAEKYYDILKSNYLIR